jgi:hypothetical protein
MLSDGLAGYFDFESDFTNRADEAGSTVTGTFVDGTSQNGAVAGAPGGIAGNAMHLRSVSTTANEHLRVAIGYGGTASAANLGTSFTVAAWYRLDSPPSGSASNRYFVYEGATDFDLSYGIRDLNGADDVTNAGINDGQFFNQNKALGITVDGAGLPGWHHVLQTFTFNGSTIDINAWIDGVALGTIYAGVVTATVNDTAINFGAPRGTVTDRGFDGLIDEVALWNRPLNNDEVAAVYQRGLAGLAIPEPSVTLLGGLGLLALLRRRAR